MAANDAPGPAAPLAHNERRGNDQMSKTIGRRTASTGQARISRRDLMKSGVRHRGDRSADVGRQGGLPGRRLRAGRGAGGEGHEARLHRADRCLAADHRQGEGLLRQARPARHGGPQAGLLGRDARQHGARHQGQRHRRRPHPAAPEGAPLHHRQGDPEQSAAADVHAAEPQRGLPGDSRSPTSTRTSRSAPTARRSRRPSRRRRPPARR